MATSGNNQYFNVTIGANMDVGGVLGAVKQMQGAFNGLKLPANLTGDILKDFDKLRESLNKFKSISSKETIGKADLKALSKLQSEIDSTFSHLSNSFDELSGKTFYLDADFTAIKDARAEVENLKADLKNKLSGIKIDLNSAQGGKVSLGIEKIVNDMERGVKTSKVLSASMREVSNSIQTGNFDAAKNKLAEIENKATTLKGASAGLLETFRQWGIIDFSGTARGLVDANKHADLLHAAFQKIREGISGNDEEIKNLVNSIDTAEEKVTNLEKAGRINAAKPISEAKDVTDQLAVSAHNAAQSERELGDATARAANEVKQLQQSTQYFFSLRNMINLLKRGIDEAVQSVKELDKAMTETAVVTDYKVSDLWGMLPEYTKVANQLGATTQGAYETMTLYYQQGLEQQQAFELGAETMKMARIAGLDYAETTDMMTAALRGFNMELNETSAKRVNDVYSELAAITASDTEELGTAMQRTASIAASAGASFEGTTAFLAQAIETTREPAENIGTAMKTIVARFQEMKKNPLEISEVDGEEVDYNKIDAALKTIGVDLKDTNGQFREFDQVMLDISAKWDTLSQSQQRYIATTAAGSRQQSRFIAMVSNYDRTMQLMEAANNSAGASDEQFGKTMDSLESKLNQLHNAWQQFTMGIANNDMIKMAVDGLTGFLNITNKIIDTLSLGSGALKSFLSIFAAFTGLKMAGRGANALIGGLGGLVDPKSSVKEGLKIGLFGHGKNAAQAKAITTPIVGSLSKISGQIAALAKRQGVNNAGQRGSTAGVKETSKEDYANTKRLFSQLSGKEGFKMGDTSKLFGNLDAKHQLSMFNNSPGTKLAMKQASLNWFNSKGLSKELTNEGKQFINSIYKGMSQGQIPVDKGIELIGQPQKWGQYFGTDMAKGFSSSFARESTQQAHQQAMQYLVGNPDAYGFRSNEFKDWYNNQATDAQKEAYAKYFRQAIDKRQGHGEAKGVVSDMGRFANDIGSVADKFTQAGYGITTFGNALSQLGGPLGVIGSGIAAFGGAISTIGASISGATGIISLFTVGITDATGAVVVAGSTIAAFAAPLAALAAGFLLVRHHIKQVKEAGVEVTETFKETSKAAEDNIAKLKSYQSEFAQLSKGVDSNGYNVSLDDSQYQRYLEIVDDIAAINPEIVEGYNAQGHAIINNNKALAETLKKQQEIRDEAYKTYTEEGSLQKLINARNISSEYRNSIVNPTSSKAEDAGLINNKKTPFAANVRDIADLLSLSVGVKDFDFTKYGIDSLDALKNGEEKAVQNFVKHRQQIETDLSNSGIKLSDAVVKSFDTLGDNADAFDEAIKPVYDNLLANVSNSKVFESIAPEFREAFNMGLKDLASQDLSAGEMSKAANNMAARFVDLTNGSGKYKDALDIVEKAQNNFASSLDETQYKADVQPAIDDLNRLKEEALGEGSAYGDALAEYLENQIQRISNFTTEGGANLTEALNTATDEIAAAEGALDSFNEATKKDFSTAAEGMKGIFDKTTETFKDSYGTEIQKHAEGMGDATFWTGAEALLSEKEIERLTKGKDGYEAAEAVKKSIEGLEPMLREGQEGFDAFTDRVLENADALDKLTGVEYDENGLLTKVPDEQWHNVAEALGISDDLLTSMLNKGRQFADISFMNTEEARKALAASDYTIQGSSSTAGNKNLYVKEDTLRMELSNAGYVRREQQNEQIEKLLAQGVKTIPASDSKELTQDRLKDMADDWGVKTLPDLIQTLNDTGDFTKDEIKDYAEKLDLIGDLDFDKVYSDLISALDNPELSKQTQELVGIHGTVSAILDQKSGSTPEKQMQDAESLRKDTFGGDGVDTAVEAFGQGKKLGKNGTLEFMTPEEFATQSKYVSDLVDDYNKAAERAQINADATTGATSKSYQRVADYYTKLAADTQREYERGLANYESNLQRQENAAKKTAEREESVRQAKIKKIPKNVKANEDNKTKTPGQTKTETIETTTKKTNTEKNETTKKTTIVDGKTTPGFKETEQATESLENKDGMVVDVATKAELAGANAVIKSLGGINDKEVSVITKGDTSGADTVKTAIANVTGKIVTIGTKLGSTNAIKIIDDKIAALARRGSNIKIGTTQYKGQNNHIPYQSMPSFGSAARGRGGTVGPKNKGGLTLTGEKGFEIAWLPRENRSIILGAGGPQMLNLPSDAVVYTHEQSKDIIKRKGIPAGSHADYSGSGYQKKYTNSTITVGNSSSTSKTVIKAANDAKRSVTTAAVKVGKVSVWWENIARKTESVQRKADQAYTKFEKYIKSMQATLKTTGTKGGGNAYIQNMSKALGYNQAQYNKANTQLKNLDKSNKKTTIKYKQGKKEKTSKVKLGNYIKYDSASGTYVIDQKKINKIAGSEKLGGKAKAKAIKEEAEKQINERLSKRNKAEDAINEAKEALDKFGEQLYETFFAWENELTKIWNLTQKITQAENNISRIKSYEELLEKQIATGITSVDNAFKENALANFELEVQQSIDKIVDRQNLLKEQQDAVSKALSLVDERETLDNINTILQGDLNETEKIGYENYAKQLTERINTQAAAQKYLNVTQNADGTLKVEFDTESFENDKLQGLYTGDAAQAIQDYVKELVESSETLNQSYDDLTNDIGGMYDSLSDLQQQWVDYANDLWDISDAESKKEAENMKKLSDSITDSLKNLLDEVKRKLDERRRQEDNAKTEKDISQKQQRLAALRADTSGGHQVEIAKLEKEIADAQQDYQRSLEDQLLDKMQQQADLASEQRERQIELQEKIAEEINNAALVDLWMSDPQKYRDQIYEAFKTSNDYNKKPLILQKDLDNQFESMMSGLTTNQSKQDILNTSIENLTGALDLLKQSIEDMQKGTSQKTIEQLRGLGLTDAQIRKAGFGIQDFIKAGTTDVKDLKAAGFSVADLLVADYKNTDIQEAGYTIEQFKTGTGIVGIEGARLAKEAGYSDKDIAKAYGTEAAMIGANVSGKVAQKANGTSASEIQSIINKSKTDNAKQGDLGTVQAGKVDINGSKKGGTIKDSHISAGGGRVGANKGSTLYTADWNEEKGAAGKKWSTITIDKLTTAMLKTYPVDAKQALIYAIQHSKPGTKLNKNMKSLVATAKIAGNYYKLNNGIYGSIGSNGKIYYNTKDGVQVWDAAAGKLTLDKYNKNNYLQKALKNNTISREYAQVLINKKAYTKKQLQDKGVKKFVTGGLANYTGPAWLDGTPSKPELVLNAKDTKNFLALKDVLARAMSGISNTSNTYGDIMYEININVDKIEKDYDVDRVVDKVKKEIIKGAGYRNVTQVRNFR